MKLPKSFISAVVLSVIATSFLTLSNPNQACANPNFGRQESIISEISLGKSSFSLSTENPSIPTDGGYSYTVEITPGDDLISVNLHFQLMREENGWAFHYFSDSIYIERSEEDDSDEGEDGLDDAGSVRSAPAAEPEVIRHVLQRRTGNNLDGLGMTEGVYYIAVIVTITTTEGVESATLQDLLVVYDPEKPELNLMPIIHLSALPSRNADGIFITSPAGGIFEERRAALEALCTWILANPQATLSLAISPLFLDELDTVAQGHAYFKLQDNGTGANNGTSNDSGSAESGDGHSEGAAENDYNNGYESIVVRHIAADSPLAQNSLRTIEAVQSAHNTGRLTLTAQGYADPNLSVLNALDLLDDIELQYAEGLSTLQDVLALEPAQLTAPWVNRFSSEYLAAIQNLLPQARIILDSNTRTFDEPALTTLRGQRPGLSRTADNTEILVADAGLSTSLSSPGSKAQFITQLLDERSEQQEAVLIPLLVRSHDDVEAVKRLIDNLELLSRYDWINLLNAEADIDAAANRLNLGNYEQPQTLPAPVQDLQASRKSLLGLEDVLYEPSTDQEAELAQYLRLSLASFAGPGIEVSTIGESLLMSTPDPVCAELAQRVQSYANSWFYDLEIHAQPITFSGSSGILPLSVLNNSNQTFYLKLRYVSPGYNVLVYPEYEQQLFLPGESFLEPSVELRNIVSGSVDIQIWAGEHLISEERVRVSATYADRIAIIVVVVLAGTGLAFYVWKRVKVEDKKTTQTASNTGNKNYYGDSGDSSDSVNSNPNLLEESTGL
jgi:hypothetical protein